MNSILMSRLGLLFTLLFSCSADAVLKQDWQQLFNGTNLNGFYIFLGSGPKNSDTNNLVQIHNRTLHFYKGAEDGSKQPFGYICTVEDFADYHLRFEYKWGTNRFAPRATVKRDSGVIYHMFGPDRVWPNGVEVQVQEGDVGDIFTVNTHVTTTVDPDTTNTVTRVIKKSSGESFTNHIANPTFLEPKDGGVLFEQGFWGGIRRVIRNPLMERDGWNTVEVIVRGDDATHIVNGKVNNRAQRMKQWDGKQWQPLTKGKILFQLEGAEVFYRNIEIRSLPAKTMKPTRPTF